jgi:ankyrin repeat protein
MKALPSAAHAALVAALLIAWGANAATPPLVAAVKAGDRAAALDLARDKNAVLAAEADGTTALHWAVRSDDLELVDRLLHSGADASAANRYGVTPLHLAAINGNAVMIEHLIKAGANPNAAGSDGETPLMTVARGGHVEAAEALLKSGAETDARETWHGQTALMWAAAQGHTAMIRTLVSHGANVNAHSNVEPWDRQVTSEPRDKWLPPGGLTPLLFSAREGCVECVPVLAELGADVSATTPDGISPIVIALINGHYDVAGALINAGTDVNLLDYVGRGALYAAIDFNTMPASNRPAPSVIDNKLSALDIARQLLEHGANPNAQLKKLPPYRAKLDRGNDMMLGGGTTPFLRAAKAGDVPAMRLLLEHGADPKLSPTRSGITPLMAAAGVGTSEQDTTGRYKTQAEAIDAIQLLIDHGADVNAAANDGRTAVHGAALQGYDDVIKFLAAHGADLTAKDHKGFTPLDTALGRAGGFGFTGQEGVVREGTAALIRSLMDTNATPSAATHQGPAEGAVAAQH